MKQKNHRFSVVDILLIAMMIAPIVFMIVLKVLTTPVSEGISISGARIYFTIPMPIQDLPITESQVNSWSVMIILIGLCLFLTRNLRTTDISARQHLAEWIVEKVDHLVLDSMGEFFASFSPLIASIIGLSAFSSLMSLFGLFSATSDVNVVAGWAILVFGLITHYKLKSGPLQYAKGFTEPVALLTPFNIISEFATPVSMASVIRSKQTTLIITPAAKLKSKLTTRLESFCSVAPIRPPTPVPTTPAMAVVRIKVSITPIIKSSHSKAK